MNRVCLAAVLLCIGIGMVMGKDCHCNESKPQACHCTTAFVEVNRVKTVVHSQEQEEHLKDGKQIEMIQMNDKRLLRRIAPTATKRRFLQAPV